MTDVQIATPTANLRNQLLASVKHEQSKAKPKKLPVPAKKTNRAPQQVITTPDGFAQWNTKTRKFEPKTEVEKDALVAAGAKLVVSPETKDRGPTSPAPKAIDAKTKEALDDVPAFLDAKKVAVGARGFKDEKAVKLGSAQRAVAKAKDEAAKAARKPAKKSVALRPDGLRAGSGMAKLVDTVCRASGATNEQLCAAVGWKQCLPMMKKACEKARVKLRVERVEGKPARYFGTARKS